MVNRHEQPSLPFMDLRRVLFQVQFMIVNAFERLKRDCAERHDNPRIDDVRRRNAEQLDNSFCVGLRLAPESVRGLHSAALVMKI